LTVDLSANAPASSSPATRKGKRRTTGRGGTHPRQARHPPQARRTVPLRLVAENGQVVATSETYTTKRRCLEGIESVKRLAADAPVEDEAPDAA
jgi:uncharacterized protein YegP (UPF0339 family)